jgi:molybdopterin-guanine dinucleotide biosynthesis protein A
MGLTVVIQAGGESRRMGRDKALVPFQGIPLIARVAGRLAVIADELLVTSNRPEELSFLGLPCFPDLLPGKGALGGLLTALSSASETCVAVVACDMPFANPAILEMACDLAVDRDFSAVIPRFAGGLEPLHAVYRPEICLPFIRAALEANRLRVDSWFTQAGVHILEQETYAALDPRGLAFINANTPEELERAEALDREENARG